MSEYNYIQSVEKCFSYLGAICRDKFRIGIQDKNIIKYIIFHSPKEVIVSDKLFRSYSCLDYGCSRCCTYVGYWNIFSANQYEEIVNNYPKEEFLGEIRTIIVNGKDYKIYVEKHIKDKCIHLKEGKCAVHLSNPIHCAFPLMRFKRVKDKVHITREYFGRNWNMKCPARFHTMSKNGYKYTLHILERTKQMAEEFNIPTYIDEIINDVKYKWEHIFKFKQRDIVEVHKITYDGYKGTTQHIANKNTNTDELIQIKI